MKDEKYRINFFMIILILISAFSLAACGSDGSEETAVFMVTVTVKKNGTFEMDISGCSFTQSTSEVANIQYNSSAQQASFDWTMTLKNGNCVGQVYHVFVHDIQYDTVGRVASAKYDYQGKTYSIHAS